MISSPTDVTPDQPLSSHPHAHSDESLRNIVNRLSRAEGHLRGIKDMVQEDRHCAEILIQISAVRGAIDRVARLILNEHLTECLPRCVEDDSLETEIAALKKALDRFLPGLFHSK